MNTIVESYLETWNATDPDARRRLLAESWSADAVYVDPMVDVTGTEAIDATIAGVHEQFPGFVFSLVGTPDGHHRQTRFRWGLGPEGEEPIVIGFDVVVTDDDGRIRQVLGFLDRVPG